MIAALNPEPIKNKEPAEQSAGMSPSELALEKLREVSLSASDIQQRIQFAQNAKFVAGKLALKGQITVFFAGPNTGKTLLSLALISTAYNAGDINEEVFHINLDDDYTGATTKAQIGMKNGFRVITNETFKSPLDNFIEFIELLVDTYAASKTIIILDTVKKFADVMDKKAMSAFMTLCRRFTNAGGSLILLAHTNKIKDDESKVIPGGTSDLLDDCDCAYVMFTCNEEKLKTGTRYSVLFEQRKARGPTIKEAIYSYVAHDDGDYFKLFNSVRNESPEAIAQAQKTTIIAREQQDDAKLIEVITRILNQEKTSQTALIELVKRQLSASRKQVSNCLNRWNISADQGGIWKTHKGDNNSIIYQLL